MRNVRCMPDTPPRECLEQAHLEISSRLLMATLREDLGGWGRRAERRDRATHLAGLRFEESLPTSMGRFQFERFPTLEGEPIARVEQLLDFLDLSGGAGLREEVSESARNLALALAAKQERVAGPALAAWDAHRRRHSGASCLAFFEQLVFRGHPIHPGAKLRKGMSPEEQRRWAPEWGVQFRLPLVGLEPHEAVAVGAREALSEAFPELDPSFAWVPVHPWQLKHVIPALGLDRRIAEGCAVRPSMSLRTLLPAERGAVPHFKTALAVQITGAVRTVSTQAAWNGPRLTRLLAELGFASSSLAILEEMGSIHWRHNDPDVAKLVSAVLRQNPESVSREDDLLMPAAALIEWIDGGPLVAEIVGQGCPVSWLREYAAALLRPLIRLMTTYGIALEGHLQNIVVRFRPGQAPYFFYRDFGGIRIFPPRLQCHCKDELEFAPGSATVTHELEELWSKIIYPVLQNHLGELIRALTLHFETPEAALWEPIRALLEEHLRRPEERDRFLAPHWRLKAMTRMRLREQVTEYSYGEVRSPLWRAQVDRPRRH
ncbi:MAG: IucA/IucC family protein [Acidobacteriota bacterium]